MDSQIGLLLMSHGDFAEAAIKSAELIIGKQENYAFLGVHIEDSLETLRQTMQDKIGQLDTSRGLVVLTDIMGGTPSNLAGSLLGRENTLVCSGLNFPMLMECSMNRDKSLPELKQIIREAYEEGLSMYDDSSFGKEVNSDDLVL